MELTHLIYIPLFIASTALISYMAASILYNLLFHPLARFPGAKLAAATRWYEYYYEIYLGGRYSDRIFELHQQYGPIIRVNPFEVHILDPSFYDTLYNFSPELDKRAYATENLQNSPSFDTHKMRRRAFDPYFSRASIQRLEPLVSDMVGKIEYSFSQPYGLLDDPQKYGEFMISFVGVFKILFLMREIRWTSWLIDRLAKLPKWMIPMDEGMMYMRAWQGELNGRLKKIVQREHKIEGGHPHPTVFEQYINDPKLPPEEKTDKMLQQNALMLVAAGLETTGFALSTATYHILANPAVGRRLKAELVGIWPKDGSLPSWTQLEKLPYLTACLKESLRLSVGVMSRLHRVNKHRPIQYKQWTIPPGAVVSMSQRFILCDADIFEEPKVFMPDRWLQGEKSKELEKWLVVFTVVHKFDLRLFDTDRQDVDPKYDHFVPFPKTDRGVRAVVI
ncbi:hypothetical protein LTR85_006977 [Meristemomyces frigidus]|nr:hypothetical protein LTR85_006977 [Meristemomyces frigidus]